VSDSERLDGWKAIAAYLGRNERTAQRWAAERAMPVHHVPGGRSGSVFAYSKEIDRWLGSAHPPEPVAGLPDGAASQISESAPAAEPAAEPIDRRSWTARRSLRWIGAAVLIATMIVAVVALRREPPVVAEVDVSDRTLIARSVEGRELWRQQLPIPEHLAGGRAVQSRITSDLVDITGDGRAEVLAFATYRHGGSAVAMRGGTNEPVRRDAAFQGQRIASLTADGRVLWTFDPRMALGFAGRRFDGPWRLSAWLGPSEPDETGLLAAFIDDVWWPSYVVAVDENGVAAVRYISSGHVYALAHLDASAARFLLAGGVNNEYGAAALAALTYNGEPATSPQSATGSYHCDACPSGRPFRYLTFPRSELNVSSGDPYNRVEKIQVSGGQVLVSVFEAPQLRTVYALSRTLDVETVGMSDRYWEAHRHAEAKGRLTHRLEDCDEYTKGMPVRVWSPATGWTTQWARQVQGQVMR
jgi:hypothetical protein